MAAKRKNHGFTALRIEGGILPPEYLQTIAGLQAPSQKGTDYGLTKSLAIKEEIARYWRIANDLYNLYAERRERSDSIHGKWASKTGWFHSCVTCSILAISKKSEKWR